MDPLRQASHRRIDIRDQEGVWALQHLVRDLARKLGATAAGSARAQLVATELATNLIHHADRGGWILTRPLPSHGLELMAVDRGPGIPDPAAAVEGRSARPKGLGCGLAAVRRASSRFDLHTQAGRGTTVLSVVALSGPAQPARLNKRAWDGVSVGVTEPCGDGWAVAPSAGGLAVAVVDGLGHGAAASEAADAAAASFAATLGDPGRFVAAANAMMHGTRGAAATVCQMEPAEQTLRYVAVGNVKGCVKTGSGRRSLITHSGTLGLAAGPPRVPVLTCPWQAGATLVVWTDGLDSQTGAHTVDPGLLAHDPVVIAATIYRDHHRGRDDATVVVVRNEAL